MYKKIKLTRAIIIIGFLILFSPAFVTAKDKTINVQCDKGKSIQEQLDKLNGPATLVVTGTCNENVVIKQDDVTIQGGTFVGPDPNQNTIQITAARRILITGAIIEGARNGVVSYQGGSVTVENSSIQGNARAGINAVFGSSAVVNNCTIQNNLYEGVVATDNSTLAVTNSTIISNGRAGVNVSRGSTARIGRNLRGGSGPNTIQNNGTGISVYQTSQAMIIDNTIQNNTWQGVFVEGASATLTNNVIRSNWKGIEITLAGNARIGINDDGSAGLGNIIEFNQLEGIGIGNGAAAYMLNNQISSNGLTTGRAGVGIGRATGRLVGGNTIEFNGGHGVDVSLGTLFQGKGDWNLTPGQDIITQNGRSGISGWNGASLDIQNANIIDNTENGIVLGLRSNLRIYNSTISNHLNPYHGIAVYDGSAAAFYHPTGAQAVSITNNTGWGVFCGGLESSLTGDTSGVMGNTLGDVSCSGL